MQPLKLSQIDLNLLVALHALLRERSVTRAGRRVGLSQPAMSAALGKLRQIFDDRLLERAGNEHSLTPLARELLLSVERLVNDAEQLFDRGGGFDPATSRHAFRIVTSDYVLCTLMQPTTELLERIAPGVTLHFSQPNITTGDRLRARELDLAIQPWAPARSLSTRLLFTDDFVVVAWRGNEAIGEELTAEQFSTLPHVSFRPFSIEPATLMRVLGPWTAEVHAQVTCESFMSLPFVLRGTKRIAVMQRRLAELVADTAELRLLKLPYPSTGVRMSMWWNPLDTNYAAHVWLRDVLTQVSNELEGEEQAG